MSMIYYDQSSQIKADKCKTIVIFDVDRIFKFEYSTYCVPNRSELCECSLTAGNYLLWRYARSQRWLLHNILCLQQDSTRHVNGEIQHIS